MRRDSLALVLTIALLAVLFVFSSPPAAADDDPPLEPTAQRPTIILLPGVMGSRLTNTPPPTGRCGGRPRGEVWPNVGGLLTFRYNQYLGTLTLAEDGRQPADGCDQVQPSGVLLRLDLLGLPVAHFYDGFLDEMRRAGYPVYPFDYDWRLDVEASAQRLDAFIQRLHAPRVVLVGHSMGGLVARQYAARSERVARLERVITVGTPYWGAPAMAEQMRSGQTGLPVDPILDDTNIWTILRNAPGPMQLLPPEAFFQAGRPAYYFIDTDRPLTSYAATARYFVERGQNAGLLEAARRRHAEIDRFDAARAWPPGFYHVLAGRHLPTLRVLREYPCAGGRLPSGPNRCVEERGYEAGDGTVPWTSAGLPAQSGAVSLCLYDAPSGSGAGLVASHGALMVDAAVIADIRRIIEGKPTTTCRPPRAGKFAPPSEFVEVAVEGEARVTLTDAAGRVAEVVAPGYMVNAAPGVLYHASEGRVVVLVPAEAAYHLDVRPTAQAPLGVRVTRYRLPADRPAEVVEQAVFVDVPASAGQATRLSLNPTAPLAALRLAVDVDPQGKARLAEAPASVLDAAAGADLTLPTTRITVDHDAAARAIVTLTAQDSGAGVLKTEYSLDGGQSWTLYRDPLTLDPAQTPTLHARATDRAGNREYPWPTVSLK